MESFQKEITYIEELVREGFLKKSVIGKGNASVFSFQSTKTDETFAGKRYDESDFIKILKEFLLEYNMKYHFTLCPYKIFANKKEKSYYLIMEKCIPLRDFSKLFSNENVNEKYLKNVDLLLIIVITLQAVQSLHVQKIPIHHHDIKIDNILLQEYQLLKDQIGSQSYTFLIPKLIDYDLSKESAKITMIKGTRGYRRCEPYSESSEGLSLAVVYLLLMYDLTTIDELIGFDDNLFIYIKNSCISEFYFKNEDEISGLKIITNMMLKASERRESNIREIIHILTTRDEIRKYITTDDVNDDMIENYFTVLKELNIIYDYIDEFKEIAPKIYGENYDDFLFAMFHQKNNEFTNKKFNQYQNDILKIKDDYQKIANYHYEKDFFNFKENFDKFRLKFDDKFDKFEFNSIMFKILTNLDFKNTRSLNHFTNALNFLVSSISFDMQYTFEICFGKDYKEKVGFLILDSRKFEDLTQFSEKVVGLVKKWDFKLNGINITHEEFYFLSFEELLKKIDKEPTKEYREKCFNEYMKATQNSGNQNKFNEFASKKYGKDYLFVLFFKCLAFYEIKDEKYRRKKSYDNTNDSSSSCSCSQSDDLSQSCASSSLSSSGGYNDFFVLYFDSYNDTIKKLFKIPGNEEEKFYFDFIVCYQINDLKNDVLSYETIKNYEQYFKVVKFLRSINIHILDFHNFLSKLNRERKIKIFKQVVLNYKNDFQLLESISYLSNDFFTIISEKIQNSNSNLIEYIIFDEFESENKLKISNNDFINLNKISNPNIFFSFGKLKYKNDHLISKSINNLNETERSKIVVYIAKLLNYLDKLPFKINAQSVIDNIFFNEKTKSLFIKLNFSNNSNGFLYDFSEIFKHFLVEDDNIYLQMITNSDYLISHIPFQYIFDFYINKEFNFTFINTNQIEFNEFIEKSIKNSFNKNKLFESIASDILGESFSFRLDYLFTKLNQNLNKTKDDFVSEMIEIFDNSSLLKFTSDFKTLNKLASLFEKYFNEDSYHIASSLNHMSIPLDKFKFMNDNEIENELNLFRYPRGDLNDKTIANIYHIMNNLIAPMKCANDDNLYFEVPKQEYRPEYFKNLNQSTKYRFINSLKCSLKYLCNCKDHLEEELTTDFIYINEFCEAIVLPFFVNGEKKMNEILDNIQSELSIDKKFNTSKLSHFYISLTDEQIRILIKIFGFDYETELKEIILINSEKQDKQTVINEFLNEIKNIDIIDKFILDLSYRVNKLSPLHKHLLEKAAQSEIEQIRNEAKRLLKIKNSLIEINPNEIELQKQISTDRTAEGIPYEALFNGVKVVYKKLLPKLNVYEYLQKTKNMLFIIKSLENKNVYKHIIEEIGFSNFGIIMKYCSIDLEKKLTSETSKFDGLYWLKFIFKFIQSIKLLHDNNIIHHDLKPSNILLDDEDSSPLLCDNLGISKENSFIENNPGTLLYGYGSNVDSKRDIDLNAFEQIFFEIIEKQFNCDPNKSKSNEMCPLISIIKNYRNNKNKSINYYYDKMISKQMYLLPLNSSKEDRENMDYQFQQFLNKEKVLLTDNLQNCLNKEINNKNDFVEIINKIKQIENEENIKMDLFLVMFARKIKKIEFDLHGEDFNYLIGRIDSVIIDNITKNINESNDTINKLIFERINLNKFNGIENENLLKMKFKLLQYFKQNELNEDSFDKIKFIIDILNECNDVHQYYFYKILFPDGKDKIQLLENDFTLRLKALRLEYLLQKTNKIKFKMTYIEQLISEIFTALINNIDQCGNFLNDLLIEYDDDDVNMKEVNYKLISIFICHYLYQQWRYPELAELIIEIENYAEKFILPMADKLNLNDEYSLTLFKLINEHKNNGNKVIGIYENIIDWQKK